MKLTSVGSALAAIFLLFLSGAFAAAAPKVNENWTATGESTETEAGGDDAAELAKQLQNPVANLIQRAVPE